MRKAVCNIPSVQLLALLLGSVLYLLSSTSQSAEAAGKDGECSPYPYPSLEHGRIRSIGKQKFGFSCNPGYFLASPETVRCYKGNWTYNRPPQCLKSENTCDDPPSIHGGKILGDERTVGSTILYMCNTGFILLGKDTRECLQGGYWGGITPTCMDEKEPLKKVGQRLKKSFIYGVGVHSNDSVLPEGRYLDPDSLKKGLELVILLDRSSSIDPHDFQTGIRFLKFLLHNFGVRNGNNTFGTRVAVFTFGTEVETLFNLDNPNITGTAAANKALDALQAGGGGTSMHAAFVTVLTSLAPVRKEAKKALFMITDGEPNDGPLEDIQFFAKSLRNDSDFEIFTVGIGRDVNKPFLATLASQPVIGHVFILDKYSDLRSIMDVIKDTPKPPKEVSPSQCGYIKHPEHYLKKWPWLAAVYTNFPTPSGGSSLGFCAATLIKEQWVITAASCFFRIHEINETEKEVINSTEEVFIVLGERDLMGDDRHQLNFYAEKVFIHPNFDPFDNLQHNVALIKLNVPVRFERNSTFRPACLPLTNRTIHFHLDLDTNASIAGWGKPPSDTNGEGINGGTVNFYLANATAVVEEENRCTNINRRVASENNFFCARSGDQTCIGNFGTPIIAVDGNSGLHHIFGVLIGRSHCSDGPNVFSTLISYVPWIEDVMSGRQVHVNIDI